MALHKYYAGLPFYRQHTLQQLFGTPLSASTVFEQCEHDQRQLKLPGNDN